MIKMDETERGRNIRFPQYIWDALDADARRCKRSAIKQLEALLTVYYDLGNIDVDTGKLKSGTPTASQTREEIEQDYKLKSGDVRQFTGEMLAPKSKTKMKTPKLEAEIELEETRAA